MGAVPLLLRCAEERYSQQHDRHQNYSAGNDGDAGVDDIEQYRELCPAQKFWSA